MKTLNLLYITTLTTACLLLLSACGSRLDYPETRTVEQVDVIHDTEVSDPYRWLENSESEETANWIKAQNQLTFQYLSGIPERQEIRERLTQLWNYEKFGVPVKRGGKYFYSYNDGLRNQDLIYKLESLDAEPSLLIDPNKLSEDGTVALSSWVISPDGKLMAYGVSSAGSDWQEWKIRDIETGRGFTRTI